MSLQVYRAVWQHTKQNGGVLVTLLALAEHSNDAGYCWPSIKRLADYCRVSERQVQRSIQKLEMDGEIETRRGDGRGNTSVYYIKLIEKGDADVTDYDSERVTSEAERVTSEAVKGDTGVTRILKNHIEPEEEAQPIKTLAEHFTAETGIFPSLGSWEDGWQLPLETIYKRAGNETAAKDLLTRAVQFARSGNGKNGNGRGYTIKNPMSLTTIIANMPVNEKPGTIKVSAR